MTGRASPCRFPVLALLLAVAACATPAEKIAARLEKAGMPHTQARCMGDRLAQRLGHAQLKQLAALTTGDGERLTVGRLVRRLGDADPALVSELIRTGVSCAI
ncbi:MAG: hypothetical protein ACRYG4_11640 [Janthinobacterium lividum]